MRVIKIFLAQGIIIFITLAFSSCKGKISKTATVDLDSAPTQVVENMSAIKSNNGKIEMRMDSPLMERYSSYEIFPNGFSVFAYNEEGLLETEINSDNAKHTTASGEEKWEAYGNVVIRNYIKGERMETDTLYWDKENQKIFTHCYVKLTSPQGVMQGYGMESDERARDAVLLRPFDSYSFVNRDSTVVVYVDSANFIGPLYKR